MLAFFSFLYLCLQLCLAVGILRHKTVKRSSGTLRPVSLIIAAHNEETNLRKHLPHWLAQTDVSYEIIIALDRCTDQSKQIVESFSQKDARLRYLQIDDTPDGWAGKKWALQQAIQSAQYEYLVLTDADCWMDTAYLSSILGQWRLSDDVLIGIGQYASDLSLLNRIIQFETFYTAFQYIGAATLGWPYMAVGRNLAYTKSFFLNHGGFFSFKERLSGDDDILVNRFANAKRTQILLEKQTQSMSIPKKSWKSWANQKFRHVSASPAYQWSSKIGLGLFHGSHSVIHLVFFFSSFCGQTDSLILA
ncbi:MAG: glycosyltransferase, partial [Bacteroidota bacterium]